MANEKNLKPIEKGGLSTEEAKRRGSKGGKASVESRRRKKSMRESFETLFAMQAPEKYVKAFKKQGMDVPDDLTTEQALTLSMTAKAIAGDARMVSLIMDIMGEKHSDKLREKELELKEKQANDMKSEAITRLDSILEGLRNEAEEDKE